MLNIFECAVNLSGIVGSLGNADSLDVDSLNSSLTEIKDSISAIASSEEKLQDKIASLENEIVKYSSLKENFISEISGKVELLFGTDESMKQSKLAILEDSETGIQKLVDLGTEINSLFREKWESHPIAPKKEENNLNPMHYLSGRG